MNLSCGFLKFQFGTDLDKNQNSPYTAQISFEICN